MSTSTVSLIEAHLMETYRLGTARLAKEIDYRPHYFHQMLGEHGAVGASVRLVEARSASDGFMKLWENERLSYTVEAIILLPWFAVLFEDHILARACRRLKEYGFPLDAYLVRETANPPSWWTPDA